MGRQYRVHSGIEFGITIGGRCALLSILIQERMGFKTIHVNREVGLYLKGALVSVEQAIEIAAKGLSFDMIRSSRLFPPIQVLNSFFNGGIDDAESENPMTWVPFSLTRSEFDVFHQVCQNRYGELRIDGLGFKDYDEWFTAVANGSRGG